MTAYAVAHLTQPPDVLPDEVLFYMERVQATLDPFAGRFLVHGGPVEIREGAWPGALVLIEFPDLIAARTWYESEAYSALKPLRTRNVAGHAILVAGVAPNYDPAETAAQLRQAGHGSADTNERHETTEVSSHHPRGSTDRTMADPTEAERHTDQTKEKAGQTKRKRAT